MATKRESDEPLEEELASEQVYRTITEMEEGDFPETEGPPKEIDMDPDVPQVVREANRMARIYAERGMVRY